MPSFSHWVTSERVLADSLWATTFTQRLANAFRRRHAGLYEQRCSPGSPCDRYGVGFQGLPPKNSWRRTPSGSGRQNRGYPSVVSAVAVVPSLKLAVMRKVLPATNRVGLRSAAKRSIVRSEERRVGKECRLRLAREA